MTLFEAGFRSRHSRLLNSQSSSISTIRSKLLSPKCIIVMTYWTILLSLFKANYVLTQGLLAILQTEVALTLYSESSSPVWVEFLLYIIALKLIFGRMSLLVSSNREIQEAQWWYRVRPKREHIPNSTFNSFASN